MRPEVPAGMDAKAIEQMKLEDGVRLHESFKTAYEATKRKYAKGQTR